jgi:hypothetical protein
VFPISEVGRVYDKTVCEGKSIIRASLHGKAVLELVRVPADVKIAARTIHRREGVVCVGQRNVFRIRKDHHIEMVVVVRSLVVNTAVIRLAALHTGKVTRVAPFPERQIHD